MNAGGLQVSEAGSLLLALYSEKVPLGPGLRARRALRNTLGACCSSKERLQREDKETRPTCNVVPKWRLGTRVRLSNLELRNHGISCPMSVQLEMTWKTGGSLERITCLYPIYFG